MREADLPSPRNYYTWHFRISGVRNKILLCRKRHLIFSLLAQGGITIVAIYEYLDAMGEWSNAAMVFADPVNAEHRLRWGLSKCHPMDNYCRKLGRTKALYKAYSKKGWTSPIVSREACRMSAENVAIYCWEEHTDTAKI